MTNQTHQDVQRTPETGKAPAPDAVQSGFDPKDSLDRLAAAARRGKLPGFVRVDDRSFTLPAHGTPFDHSMLCEIHDADPEQVEICFSLRMLKTMPTILIVLMILTVEPGQTLVDTMIPGSWGWIDTWIWYYPLAILSIPLTWFPSLRVSRKQSAEHARTQASRVRAILLRDNQ